MNLLFRQYTIYGDILKHHREKSALKKAIKQPTLDSENSKCIVLVQHWAAISAIDELLSDQQKVRHICMAAHPKIYGTRPYLLPREYAYDPICRPTKCCCMRVA